MGFRDVTSVVIGTTVMLIALFGVLFFMSSQCFAPADPRLATMRPTSTALAGQGGADATRVASSNDSPPGTATPASTPSPLPTTAPQATSTPVPAPTRTPLPQAESPSQPPAAPAAADLSGAWQIVDTVTEGSGAGQTFRFDVILIQDGNVLSGGNSGLLINGTVSGNTASATFTQPALGITGSFTWTLTGSEASGTFTSSVPNAGTSRLVRR